MTKKIVCFFAVILLILSNQPNAFAWSALTHYYINQQNSAAYSPKDTFNVNGIAPDMFISIPLANPLPEYGEAGTNWADIVHCPNPKILPDGTTPFEAKPNTSYLMYAIGNGNSNPLAEAYSLGWGGHISADWVAHNKNLFPLTDEWKCIAYHINGELLCDYYVFLTRGPIISSFNFNPDLINKALANCQLTGIHETQPGSRYSDSKLKSLALDQALPKSTIRSCCKRWAGIVISMQTAYAIKALHDNVEIPQFIEQMRAKGVEENILLSERSVRDWLVAKTPRGPIPDYSTQVVPFYPFPIAANLDEPSSINNNPFAWVPTWLMYPFQVFAPQPARASDSIQEEQATEQSIDSDKITYNFWAKVAKEAESAGIIQYEETISEEDGEEQYGITPQIKDRSAFENILASVIQEEISNPTSDEGRRYALFCRNFLEEGISNPDVLTDTTPPAICNLTPDDNSTTPYHKPTFSFQAIDGLDGIGIDPESVEIAIDGQPAANPEYIHELDLFLHQTQNYLATGNHTLAISVADKAGNKTRISSRFFIGNVFDHTLFSDEQVELKGCPQVTGNFYSRANFILSGSPTIKGDIYTTSQISKKGNTAINGSINENIAPLPFPEMDFEYYEELARTQGTFITGDKKLNPGQGQLPEGLVFVDGDINLNGDFKGNNSEGLKTTIVSTGEIRISGNMQLAPAHDDLLLISKDNIEIAGNNNLTGAVYSENGTIMLKGSNNCHGAITAKSDINITGGSIINH